MTFEKLSNEVSRARTVCFEAEQCVLIREIQVICVVDKVSQKICKKSKTSPTRMAMKGIAMRVGDVFNFQDAVSYKTPVEDP